MDKELKKKLLSEVDYVYVENQNPITIVEKIEQLLEKAYEAGYEKGYCYCEELSYYD